MQWQVYVSGEIHTDRHVRIERGARGAGLRFRALHPPEDDHPLKEVDRAALAVAREPEQVVGVLRSTLEDEAG